MNLNSTISNNKIKSLIILLIIFLIHIFCINFYPINDEFIFPVGAKLLEGKNIEIIGTFFKYNANTLGFSTVIFFFSKFIPLNYYLIGKLLSSSGIILIYIGINNLIKISKTNLNEKDYLLILLILLNPIIFIFSFRATPDFFSATLALFSVTFLILNKNFFFKCFFLILFSCAVIIKPINAIIILLIFYNFDLKKNFYKNNINLFLWASASMIIPVIFFIYNFYLFDFFLIPNNFKLLKNFHILLFLMKFISYLGFFNLFILPLYFDYLFKNTKINYFKLLSYIVFSTLLSSFFIDDIGEINFGFLQAYFNYNFFSFILLMSFCIFLDFVYFSLKRKDFDRKLFIFSIFFTIIFIFILSIFHPSQRYLLIMLPLLLLTIFNIQKNKFFFILTISLYILMNTILFVNHYSTSNNIKNVVVYLKKNKMIQDTYPGFIGQHALNYFIDFNKDMRISMDKDVLFDKNKKYYVSDLEPNDKKNIIFFSKSKNFFKKNKNLYILKNKF
jgi:hypothetical protein